jgi:hypothetical protein
MLEALIVNFTNSSEGGSNVSDWISGFALLVSFGTLIYSNLAAKTANAIALLDVRAKIAMEVYDFLLILTSGKVDQESGIFYSPFKPFEIKNNDFNVAYGRKISWEFRVATFKAKYVFTSEVGERINEYHRLISEYLNVFDGVYRNPILRQEWHENDNLKMGEQDGLYSILRSEGEAILELIDKEARVVIKSPFDPDINP